MKYYDVSEKKISVIYHGNSFQNFENIKSTNLLNFKYFLFIGSRKRYKNFFKVVEAFKKIKRFTKSLKLYVLVEVNF